MLNKYTKDNREYQEQLYRAEAARMGLPASFPFDPTCRALCNQMEDKTQPLMGSEEVRGRLSG